MKLHEAGLASGRPLLLLNPFPLHRGVWADNVATWIGRGYRVLTTDYPGLEGPGPGGTGAGDDDAAAPADRPMSPMSIDGLADAAVAELDARAIAQVAILGVSMGGYVALSLAARFPGRLAGLLLADTRAAADSPAARAGRVAALATLQQPAAGAPEAEIDADIETAAMVAAVETYLGSSLPKLLAPAAPAHLHERVRALAIRRRASLIAGIVALRDRPDRSAALPTLHVPTLVLSGSDDQIVPAAEMQEMARAIPGARFEAIPGAGHLPNLEQPARFEALVGAFLEELVGTAA
jgi:pimeloyl-ACP methyl ester carboxylesterase